MSKARRPRVIVTRSADQAEVFSDKLNAVGFTPVEFPAIAFTPLPWEPLDAALAQLDTFDWLVFTSGNAVDYFFQRFDELNTNSISKLPRVAASGSATARKLAKLGIQVDFIPDEFVSNTLVSGLAAFGGRRVLLPRAKIGRPEIIKLLEKAGKKVTEVPLYDTIPAVPTPEAIAKLHRGWEAITFTSPSSVRNFIMIVKDIKLEKRLLEKNPVVCIGPITAQAAEDQGLIVTLVPEEYTIDGMVDALASYFWPGKEN